MTSIIYPIKNEPKVRSLKDIVKEYENSLAPEEFQRPEAWRCNDRKSYFQSLLMNRLEGNFVVVDLELASNKLQRIAPQNRAHNFFKNLESQGYEYIILDGNNRFKFLSALMRDEWQIPKGVYTYVLEDDVQQLVVGPHNNTFSKLPKLVRNLISKRQVVISEYTQIDYKGLSEVFLNVNSGVELNPQEKRNAFGTAWADYVRELRKDLAPLMLMVHGDNHKYRLKSDNWIADALCFVRNVTPQNTIGITQITKNALYRSDFNEDEVQPLTLKFQQLMDYVTSMITDENVDLDETEITRPVSCMNLLWMMCNGIETYDEAVDAMILHEKFYGDTSTLMNDKGRNFQWACGFLGSENNEIRMNVLPSIIKQVTAKVAV